jgi:amino acid transporter
MFVWVMVASGLTWMMATARTQAAAGMDGVGPAWLGRISARTGTPVRATLSCGLLAMAICLAAFAVAGRDNAKYFSTVLTLSIALLVLANLVVFPALLRLRRTHPATQRPFRVPGGRAGAVAACVLATGWSVMAITATVFPGLGTAHPDMLLPEGFAGERLAFTLTGVVPLAALLLAAAVLSRSGRHGRQPAARTQVP